MIYVVEKGLGWVYGCGSTKSLSVAPPPLVVVTATAPPLTVAVAVAD